MSVFALEINTTKKIIFSLKAGLKEEKKPSKALKWINKKSLFLGKTN